jgi:hypothetical protein
MNRGLRMLRMAVIGVAAITLGGWVVSGLWNWLMPAIFGVHEIGFWQGLGLLVLSRLFFGGFRGGHGHGFGRRRMMRRWAERWEKMTPEEREKFREGMRRRCGGFGMQETEPGVQA